MPCLHNVHEESYREARVKGRVYHWPRMAQAIIIRLARGSIKLAPLAPHIMLPPTGQAS